MQHPKSSSGNKKAATKASKAKKELTGNAKKALALKKRAASHEPSNRPPSKTAGKGMRPIPNNDIAPSGALEQEGQRPVLERSRKVR